MSIVSMLRLVGGGAMVAGGVVLCVPLTTELFAVVVREHGEMRPAAASPVAVAPDLPGMPFIETPAAAGETAAAGVPFPEPVFPPESGLPIRSTYVPPVPPPVLAGPTPGPPLPEVDPAYRSMLEIPPPNLLDAQRPPTSVSWSAAARPALAARPLPGALVPATYVVRDGDDLEGIATRYYGHPSAAAAIWGANRERLPDPRVLPIGLELRLPPPWTVGPVAGDVGAGTAIEPPTDVRAFPSSASGVAPAGDALTTGESRPWLTQVPAAVAVSPLLPAPAAAPRPAAVRVAPGETLATVARRFYGDEREAERIWQANRDRLRAPQLLVPGMELRLP